MLTGLLITTLIVLLCAGGCSYKSVVSKDYDVGKIWGVFSIIILIIFAFLFLASYFHVNTIISNQLDLAILTQGI